MSTYVTKPFLPPLEEFMPYLDQIWESRILSNGGEFHQLFEKRLCQSLGVNHISLLNNGTMALLLALKSLEIENADVITTPYSFVATSNSLLWTNNTPVFADIEKNSPNIDPVKIEPLITEKTKAILAVHCYGFPCRTHSLQKLASRYGLKIIYDAAHAFGVNTKTGSLLNEGDLSILSFHATKVFNTFEGGAIVCHNSELKSKIDRLKNFGYMDELHIAESGINAKMNEVSAAMGLLQLQYFDSVLQKRSIIDKFYRKNLDSVTGITCLENPLAHRSNFAYFPILVEDSFSMSRDLLHEKLKSHGVYARRYFFPLISDFIPYRHLPSAQKDHLPYATKMAQKVLCLPIFPEMPLETAQIIVDTIQSCQFTETTCQL